MRAGIFAIRHQKAGVVIDCTYTAEPSAETLSAEKARLDKIYGAGWVRPVLVGLELAPEHEDLAPRFAAPPEPPPPPPTDGGGRLPGLVIRARGDVIPPR